MKNILVTDIFGKTKATEAMALDFGHQCEILSPYGEEQISFDNEAQAYDYFMTNVGLELYVEKLTHLIKATNDKVQLTGFSVGASAIWMLSDDGTLNDDTLSNVSSATCFYGSQIRYHKQIQPLFPVTLVLPHYEKHFSVADLMSDLSQHEHVRFEQTAYLHGFMNTHSVNFDATAYADFCRYVHAHFSS